MDVAAVSDRRIFSDRNPQPSNRQILETCLPRRSPWLAVALAKAGILAPTIKPRITQMTRIFRSRLGVVRPRTNPPWRERLPQTFPGDPIRPPPTLAHCFPAPGSRLHRFFLAYKMGNVIPYWVSKWNLRFHIASFAFSAPSSSNSSGQPSLSGPKDTFPRTRLHGCPGCQNRKLHAWPMAKTCRAACSAQSLLAVASGGRRLSE
jgi:hypothetical protein